MLGARIALLRKNAKLSQRELAAALHVSPSAVGMYEQERRVPTAALLVSMAEILGCSTDFLLTGNSIPADRTVLTALRCKTQTQWNSSPADTALLLAGICTAGELTAAEKSAIIEPSGGDGMTDEAYMREALRLAQEAADEGEVPVGCVIVDGDRIVGRGRNRRESVKNALAHAELAAIDEACRTLGGWRLWRCTLYVTLEPCPMCAGAIVNARLARVVYGARDEKGGACGSLTNLFAMPGLYRPKVATGVLEQEAQELLQRFFQTLRRQEPKPKTWKNATL